MVLSDRTIREEIARGRIVIEPFDESCIQPASVDIHLAKKLVAFRTVVSPYHIDLKQPLDGLAEIIEIPENGHFPLLPGQFVLGSTKEYVAVPDDLMARLEGKSSLGRIGLLIHATAGYVDPGWKGHLTLELCNVCTLPILLYEGMKISQLSFHRLTTPAERPYGSPELGSKYQGQTAPTFTRYYQEFPQPRLMTEAPIAVGKSKRRKNAALQEWLKTSKFGGSVKRFSEALGVPVATVEDWLYRGSQPSEENLHKIYKITQLPQFRPRDMLLPPLGEPEDR